MNAEQAFSLSVKEELFNIGRLETCLTLEKKNDENKNGRT